MYDLFAPKSPSRALRDWANAQLLNGAEASALLGICRGTLVNLRKRGLICYFVIQSPSRSRKRPFFIRYPIQGPNGLQALLQKGFYSPRTRLMDPRTATKLPVSLFARIAGVCERTVMMAKLRGELSDYSMESCRRYILEKDAWKHTAELRKRYGRKLSHLNQEIRRARSRLQRTCCPSCQRKSLAVVHRDAQR